MPLCRKPVRCSDAEITSPDGTRLRGSYFETEAANGGALMLLHGVGDSRQDVVSLGSVFLRAGYSVLTPDLRGHGKSGGILTYGVREAQDVHGWADWMLRQPHVARIDGFGASLGASELLVALDREHRFRAVVAESAYSSFSGIAYERMRRIIPDGLKWITGPFVGSGMLWARVRYGVDLWDASPLDALRRTRVPVLPIHGLADDPTSPDNSRALAAANPRVTELWMIPGAGHANGWATAIKEFESRVLKWFIGR